MLKNSKINNRILLLFVLSVISLLKANSQETIKGKIMDKEGNPVFAVNVILKSNFSPLTISDLDGKFEFQKNKINQKDTILFSCMGYNSVEKSYNELNSGKEIAITLKENEIALDEVTVLGKQSISKEFSVKELDRVSIYMAPASSGDPLRAITLLPYSTNTSESANPEIRGSSSDYSRVIVNNVPVYKPVRNSQLNGIGHFSLLNTDLIGNQLVYAGNPPLKFGNSTSGLVEVETIHRLETDSKLKFSSSLASVGLLYSQPLKEKTSFIQLYGNFQFSIGYTSLNRKNLDYIKDFRTYDVGLNYRQELSKKTNINIYSYAVKENYNADNVMYNFCSNMYSTAKRNFNIININYRYKNLYFSINNGTNFALTKFVFGNYNITQKDLQIYTSLDSKIYLNSNISLQGGVNHDHSKISFNNILPYYYYAMKETDLSYSFKNTERNNNIEAYLYGKINFNKGVIGFGLRKNAPTKKQDNYLSYQANVRLNMNDNHSMILSGGKYNGYNIPNYIIEDFSNVSSNQISLDYLYNKNNLNITASAYYRKDKQPVFYQETGGVTPTIIETYGVEFSLGYSFSKFNVNASYVYLFAEMNDGEKWFDADNRMKYIVKGSINYYNNKIFNASINFIARPGLYYTPITSSVFDEEANSNKPLFGTLFSNQYNSYSSVDLSINKIISWGKFKFTTFASLTNILNTSNREKATYNEDYSKRSYWLYQKRILYFGASIAL
ncbi:TonB-dependent receptor [Bacteroidaceae bacterium HV4-6-C5C]|nr:TonB-dependent receptor [Bacteroidaceae bacterium HV4-6-C5C]